MQNKMTSLISRFFCIVHLIAGSTGYFVNNWDQPFNFNCPPGQVISYVSSIHDNGAEDRRWEFLCRAVANTHSCSHSGYVNTFDNPVVFRCPGHQVMTGVNSYHSNGNEDRRYGFYCCNVASLKTCDCYITGYVNDWDEKLTLVVPEGKAIKGAFSHHDNGREDRIWQFEICNL
ncbi:unnamed protein product [Lymnaea stagnalis]|uniref:Dermatopontin n=1 Tax=Lymnaea stagnalis TaxID=6523 RepID=A0AAV2I150_LYMST